MVSNGTLEWSGGDARRPVARVLHLMPSVARLGPDFKCAIRRVSIAPQAVLAGLGLGWAGAAQGGWGAPPLPGPPRGTPRGGNMTNI